MNVVSLFLYLYSIGRQHAPYKSRHSIYVEFHLSSVVILLPTASDLLVWGLQHIMFSSTPLYLLYWLRRESRKDIFWLIVIFISSYIIYPAYKLNYGGRRYIKEYVVFVFFVYAILSSSDVVSNIMIVIVSKMFTKGIIFFTGLKYDHVWSFFFCLWSFQFSFFHILNVHIVSVPWMNTIRINISSENEFAGLPPCIPLSALSSFFTRFKVGWVEIFSQDLMSPASHYKSHKNLLSCYKWINYIYGIWPKIYIYNFCLYLFPFCFY